MTIKPSSGRRSPVQGRGRLMVQRILDATRIILKRDGFQELSTNGLAIEAGIAVGTIYQYFPNKQSILHAITQEWLSSIQVAFEAYIESCSHEESFELVFRTMITKMHDVEQAWGVHLELTRASQQYLELRDIYLEHGQLMGAGFLKLLRIYGSTVKDADLLKMGHYCMQINNTLYYYADTHSLDQEVKSWCVDAMLSVVKRALPSP